MKVTGQKITIYNPTDSNFQPGTIVTIKGNKGYIANYADTNITKFSIGYVINNINESQYGEVLLEGTIEGINTDKFGDASTILYLGGTGNIITTAPTTPIILGSVSNSNEVFGSIYFKVILPAGSGGGPSSPATWGSITGTLSAQTDLQTALNAKEDTITGAATTVTTTDLTGSRVLVSNPGGKIAVSAVTTTEVGYLVGVTSDIQTQLDGKQQALTLTTTGSGGVATLGSGILNIPNYSAASNIGKTILGGSGSTTLLGSGVTYFASIIGIFIATGSDVLTRTYLRSAGQMTYASVFFSTAFTGSCVCTLMVSGSATAMTFTIAAGSAAGVYPTMGTSLTSVSIADTDYVSFRMAQSGGGGGTIRSSSFVFVNT